LISPPEQYACCSAAIKHGEFNEDLKKWFESHPKDFAVRQKLAEIFIVRCDFTGKITQPASVTKLSNISTHTGKTRQCHDVSKKNFEIRNGMTCIGYTSQKHSKLIYRKGFDFFSDHARKIPSISPFYCNEIRTLVHGMMRKWGWGPAASTLKDMPVRTQLIRF